MLIFLWLVFLFVCVSCLFYGVYKDVNRRRIINNFKLFDEPKIEIKINEGKILDNLSSTLTSSKDDIDKKLNEAGVYNSKIAQYYMTTKYLVALFGGLLIYIFLSRFELTFNPITIVLAVWFVFCIIGPDTYLSIKKKILIRDISNKLPYLLDLMAICIQTGMTLESSMSYLSYEMEEFDKHLSYQLKKINERTKIVSLDKALDEFYNRISTPEVRSFVMTLKQSLKYGSSIFDVLTTLASDIREVNMLGAEEKIGKLAAKMSIPLVLFIMMPIVILITAPGIIRVMSNV